MTTARTPGGSPLNTLAKQLILRMRQRFGEAGTDLKAQEIITQEVMTLVQKAGSLKEEDIGGLINRIRDRLTGATPAPHTMVAEARAKVEGDEWARIFEYTIAKGQAKDRAEQEAARQRQAQVRATLQAQIKEQEQRRRQEAEEAAAYAAEEKQQLKTWEQQEEAKRKLQQDIMAKLRLEREEQLKDKTGRRAAALNKVRQEEDELAARMLYETKTEFMKEETQRMHQKEALKGYMMQNEENKRMREAEKLRQWDEDKACMVTWEAKLNKQEADRKAHVEKLKIRQSMQAEAAKSLPESKRWLDPEIIERHYREREEAQAREQMERELKLKEGGKVTGQRLEEQMRERQALKAEDRRRDLDSHKLVLARMAADEAREAERKRRAEEMKNTFRAALDAQLKENARRAVWAPMTETERQINSKLLTKVHDFQSTGRVTPPNVGPRTSSIAL